MGQDVAGPEVVVQQLQTLEWKDLTAPDSTKIMRDLVHQSRHLNRAGGKAKIT